MCATLFTSSLQITSIYQAVCVGQIILYHNSLVLIVLYTTMYYLSLLFNQQASIPEIYAHQSKETLTD